MRADAPHRHYFRAREGHWRGKVRFEITDPGAFKATPLRVFDRWSMRSMAVASRLSTMAMSTTVDAVSRGHRNEVLHTTRVSNLGVLVYRSTETVSLDEDGRSFRVTGRQAFFPLLWRAAEWEAHGAVATDHDGAVYHIPTFGVMMEQRTRMTTHGLDVTQTTPFSRATILLRWQRPLRAEPTAAADRGGV